MKKRIEQLEPALQARSAPAASCRRRPSAACAGRRPARVQRPWRPRMPLPAADNFTPFAYGDFTWLNGTPRNKDTVLDTKVLHPGKSAASTLTSWRILTRPVDHTMGGATESFRSASFRWSRSASAATSIGKMFAAGPDHERAFPPHHATQ